MMRITTAIDPMPLLWRARKREADEWRPGQGNWVIEAPLPPGIFLD